MKSLAIAFLFFVAIPFYAQEDVNETFPPKNPIETVADKEDTTKIVEKEDPLMEDEFKEDKLSAEEPKESNLPLIISTVAIVLSVLSIINLYHQKKMRKKSNLPSKISAIQQSQEELKNIVGKLSAEVKELRKENERLYHLLDNIEKKHTGSANDVQVRQHLVTDNVNENPSKQPTHKEEKKKTAQSYYANGVKDDDVKLKVLESDGEERAAFIIEAIGDKGTYSFNDKATASMLMFLSRKVTPFCDTAIDSTVTPSRIETIEEGTVEKKGAFWVVTKKAKVRVM